MMKDGGKKDNQGQDKKVQQYGVIFQSVDFNDWYNEVVKKVDFVDNLLVVGVMVVWFYGLVLWENIQCWFDDCFKVSGYELLIFLIFIFMNFIMKEVDYVEGFVFELFMVNKIGIEELVEFYVMCLIFEMIIGYMWSGWFNFYCDLFFLYYQWGSVFCVELWIKVFFCIFEFFWYEGYIVYVDEVEVCVEVCQ